MTFLSVRSTIDILILDARKRAPGFGDLERGGGEVSYVIRAQTRGPFPTAAMNRHSLRANGSLDNFFYRQAIVQ